MLKNHSEIRVRYADTDKMQVVYNAKYFEYFEVGRTDLLRNIGLTYRQIEDAGYMLPVLECSAKYLKYARYDDILIIESSLDEIPKPFLLINYLVYNKENNELLVEGFTKHIFVKSDSFKPVRPYSLFLEKINKYF